MCGVFSSVPKQLERPAKRTRKAETKIKKTQSDEVKTGKDIHSNITPCIYRASGGLNPSKIENFKARMKKYYYELKDVPPHGSYLINLGNPDVMFIQVFDVIPCRILRAQLRKKRR
ncbi:hypothetical protein IW262DRAFT_1301540 [Armillaria fumosa]|nr:hypothetical protein IW262DRAFT_1301540 [Armillaria fumosa]